MLNICVKYVNNSCITKCKTGVYNSTITLKNLYIYLVGWLKTIFINQTNNQFSSPLSTLKNTQFHLMNKSFTHYPQRLLLRLLNEI